MGFGLLEAEDTAASSRAHNLLILRDGCSGYAYVRLMERFRIAVSRSLTSSMKMRDCLSNQGSSPAFFNTMIDKKYSDKIIIKTRHPPKTASILHGQRPSRVLVIRRYTADGEDS